MIDNDAPNMVFSTKSGAILEPGHTTTPLYLLSNSQSLPHQIEVRVLEFLRGYFWSGNNYYGSLICFALLLDNVS